MFVALFEVSLPVREVSHMDEERDVPLPEKETREPGGVWQRVRFFFS